MFEKEIAKYDSLARDYINYVALPMGETEFSNYSVVLFSCHSCGIEGSTFSVDDTRALFEQQLGYQPTGKSLLECQEMADHFAAYRYMHANLDHPFDEELLREINRLVTLHTLTYKVPDAIPGEYTTVDMAAGDTVFGNHQQLVAQVPGLMEATAKAMKSASVHPMIVSARFHGYFEYLHPFRDGNGRTGRLLSNFILLSNGLPELIIRKEWREEYVAALRAKRTEGTDEHLIAFFFRSAIDQMEEALEQKRKASRPILFF